MAKSDQPIQIGTMGVQPVIAAHPKAQEGSAAPKTGPLGSFSILLDDFLDVMEAANAAISSECFYEECWFFCVVHGESGVWRSKDRI